MPDKGWKNFNGHCYLVVDEHVYKYKQKFAEIVNSDFILNYCLDYI